MSVAAPISTSESLNPQALPIDFAARLLTKVGGIRITTDQLHLDIENGAPTNPDGTLNLVHYTAWLVRELNRENLSCPSIPVS